MTGMLEWSAALPEVTVPGGTVLIAEGEVHSRLYVLVDGAVEVSRAGSTLRVVDGPGAVFGEMSALLGGSATATVRAVRETRLRRSDDGPGFLRSQPAVTHAVATMLAQRLDVMSGYLVDLRHQYADRDGTLGMLDTVLDSLRHHQSRAVEPGSEREPDGPY
ncbi:MAG: family transcriptional regulator, cyclic receptor protein [Pseudonocardiales bacterium]|nr:family transcriptional regulator, cyclic receptor protein [Pseudonocardiales bacterium]